MGIAMNSVKVLAHWFASWARVNPRLIQKLLLLNFGIGTSPITLDGADQIGGTLTPVVSRCIKIFRLRNQGWETCGGGNRLRIRHCLVSRVVWMDVIAGVEFRPHSNRPRWITNHSIESADLN